MVMSCKEIWREISNYIDGDFSPEMRDLLEVHLSGCRHCSALLDSTRNVLILIADDRTFELPAGFSERLQNRLAAEIAAS